MAIQFARGEGYMETIEKLPDSKPTIGAREVVKAINGGSVRKVVLASNCPEFLEKRILDATKFNESGVEILKFTGDQSDLGTKIGKPFPVALVGYSQ